ncbi:hypothetical protein IKF20_02250 [Candidatus Saccharibacteria bacterium]|nr:hypothetical protein [Candidatus Saccharibacteria bacterium]
MNKKKIDKEMVVLGLKYLAENQGASNREIYAHLKEMGWNYSWDDFYNQFPLTKIFNLKLFNGMKRGSIWAGADLLINLSTGDPDDPWFAREYVFDRFLSVDDEFSIYHFIRKVTNNNSYTMANITSLSN